MTRFYIDLRYPDSIVRDDEGAEYGHIEDALQEARASAQDVVRHHLDNHKPMQAICVEVRDENGVTVATLTVAEVLAHPVHPQFKSDCADVARPGHA